MFPRIPEAVLTRCRGAPRQVTIGGMAAEMLLMDRIAERSVPGEAVPEPRVPGQETEWQEMMALLLRAWPVAPSSEQQTCTECDSETVGCALPPENFLG